MFQTPGSQFKMWITCTAHYTGLAYSWRRHDAHVQPEAMEEVSDPVKVIDLSPKKKVVREFP